MSDDIERLLREVGQTTGSAPKPPASTPSATRRDVDKPKRSPGGRLAFALIMAVVLGGASWGLGVLLPFTGAIAMGLGGAFSAFLTGLVAGPPRWFSS
jgi:hypothetical protein